jgi:hypothetical protein
MRWFRRRRTTPEQIEQQVRDVLGPPAPTILSGTAKVYAAPYGTEDWEEVGLTDGIEWDERPSWAGPATHSRHWINPVLSMTIPKISAEVGSLLFEVSLAEASEMFEHHIVRGEN